MQRDVDMDTITSALSLRQAFAATFLLGMHSCARSGKGSFELNLVPCAS